MSQIVGKLSFLIFLEPISGPNIRTITPTSSTSLMVDWEELSHDDANGAITEYRVCYKPIYISGNFCQSFKTAFKNFRSTTLSALKKYTVYVVAVQAATATGLGPPGISVVARTLEDIPAKGAIVTNVYPVSSTILEVNWKKLQERDTNGNITGYMVCYSQSLIYIGVCESSKYVIGADNATFNLTDLNEATLYYIAVKAATQAGFGQIGNIVSNKTLEDGKYIQRQYQIYNKMTYIGSSEGMVCVVWCIYCIYEYSAI